MNIKNLASENDAALERTATYLNSTTTELFGVINHSSDAFLFSKINEDKRDCATRRIGDVMNENFQELVEIIKNTKKI